jgi:hypothetical protein
MVKINKTITVIASVFVFSTVFFFAKEEIKDNSNKKPVEGSLLVKDLIKKECYAIFMVPFLLNTIEDPVHDENPPYLSSKKLAVINGKDTKIFLKLLSECHLVTKELMPGDEYKMIILMNKQPTSDKSQTIIRILEDRIILKFDSLNIEATDELRAFITSLLLPLE